MVNHLAASSSLYLRQHADNPVDWWGWGEDAFAEARRRDVPVFVSLGYSSCHWCHVMAHESFSDEATARVINENFVAIKVDREEHPAVDSVFMTVTQALTGQGGWPNSVFCTPDGRPFFAGTYFPPEARGGQPSFVSVLEALAGAWRDRRAEVEQSASHIAEQLGALRTVGSGDDASAPGSVSAPGVLEILDSLTGEYDPIHGGFGTAPKFPNPTVLDALLVKGDPTGLDIAQWTLECMARGGIHDQVGGGFHRYAVDTGWIVPHFEKMLYDNAMLLGTYTRCWRRTADHDGDRRALFERAIYGIVEWLRRDMLLDGGGFAAALDADSADAHGRVHEGIYYLWNPALLDDALGEQDGSWARQVFHVHEGGTVEHGLSTLQLRGGPDPERLDRVLTTLLDERSHRFAPARDEKVVACWNGLLIDSLVNAGMIFAEPEWVELARGAADYLLARHVVGSDLRRTSVGDSTEDAGDDGAVVVGAPGVTEDYAAVALGLARLAGAVGEDRYLDAAVALLERAIELFGADDGGFVDGPQVVFATPRELTDTPTPSATATMVAALRLAGALAGLPGLVERAERAASTLWTTIEAYPRQSGWGLADVIESDEARRGLARALVTVVGGGVDDRLTQAAWRMAPAGSAIRVVPGDGTPRVEIERSGHHFDPVTDYGDLKTPLWTRV